MIIWTALLIPICAIAILFWKFAARLGWWEPCVLVAVPALFILGSKGLIEHTMTAQTEYWGGYVVRAEYYEDWDEEVSCRHSYQCNCVKGANGSTSCSTCYMHAYDVDYHPAQWQVIDSNGAEFPITQAHFEELSRTWGERAFVGLHRRYHSKDGNCFVAHWNGQRDSQEPTTKAHSYENRVAVSDSIFNYPPVPLDRRQEFGLFDYPPVVGYYQRTVLGVVDSGVAERSLQYLNATLGKSKQVRVFILVFHNQPIDASLEQEAYWKRGNKNEFITCIGVNDAGIIEWARAFSWTEVESLKTEAADALIGHDLSYLPAYIDWLYSALDSKWQRKQFADFAYLTIDPPMWAIVLTFILTGLVTGGLSYWITHNDFDR